MEEANCVIVNSNADFEQFSRVTCHLRLSQVGSPGRIVDHLENTKGFNLKSLKVSREFLSNVTNLIAAIYTVSGHGRSRQTAEPGLRKRNRQDSSGTLAHLFGAK